MGYDPDKHAQHVQAGYCASVSGTGAWCNKRQRHTGDHQAPLHMPDGNVESVYWQDRDVQSMLRRREREARWSG